MKQNSFFSVIIPTYNRNSLLANCLDCLAPSVQTLPIENYEVIVTDDSFETTAETMICGDYPWAKWVAGPRKGPAANRNNGARYARGGWLVFTDDDCLPDRQWLEAYVEAIANHSTCLVFEGKTYVDRPRQSLSERAPLNETGGYLWSCNFAIQRQFFVDLDGFNEQFPYAAMEDVDLRLRITKLGEHYLFIPSASVCHPWRWSGGWRKYQQHHKSTLIYLSIHPDELKNINSLYYLRLALRGFVRDTLPNITKFRGRGIGAALISHLAYLQMSILLLLRRNFFNSRVSLDR